jgi:superfamily II DNA/RNA helicase
VHAEAAAAKAAAAPVKAVKLADISRWKPFGLDKRLERGLSELGFSAPTKIQEECLPSAVLHGHVCSCACRRARQGGRQTCSVYV